jgi:NADPH:quinone reductase-like Zn-dependent oxidoreductase
MASVLLGKSMNFLVVSLSRSVEKRARLKTLGADFVCDPMDRNLVKAVTAAISPKKEGLVVDNVGGGLLAQVIALLGMAAGSASSAGAGGPCPI